MRSQAAWLLLAHLLATLQHNYEDWRLIWEDPSSHARKGRGCGEATSWLRRGRQVDRLLVAVALVTRWTVALAHRGPTWGR